MAFHDGGAAIRIPLVALLSGNITPDRIRLQRGALTLQIGEANMQALTSQLMLENVDLNWRYDDWHGHIASLSLRLDSAARNLQATSPSLHASVQLDDDGYPRSMTLHCQHTDWLPVRLSRQLHGDPEVNIGLLRQSPHRWAIKFSVISDHPLSIMPGTTRAMQLNHLNSDMVITTALDNGKQMLQRIDVNSLHWELGKNYISARGHWQDGILNMRGDSDHLSMPLIWSWLRPFGDDDWRHWLALMHDGVASNLKADVTLSWPDPLQHWPTADALHAMQYHLQAQMNDADFALGVSDNALRHSKVRVDLNQDGMHADFLDAVLPRQLGHFSGKLYAPWDTMEMHISGNASTDVNRLLQWLGPTNIPNWTWKKAKAHSTFKLLWKLNESTPKQASATLHPDGDWQVSLLGLDMQLSDGEVQWDEHAGLTLKSMHIKNNLMQATLSLQAAATGDTWSITALNATGTARLAPLAAHFQLPLSHPDGSISTSLVFDGKWHGLLDLKNASWEQLLGSSKKTGDPLVVRYQGELDMQTSTPTIHLNKLASHGNKIKLYEGSLSINKNGLTAQLNGLHTPSFSGSLGINVPFDNTSPWKIDARASYLNRNALPKTIDHPDQILLNKGWLLRADIQQLDWDDARMSGVHINMSSDKNSIGILEAAQIHTAQLDIMDVDARFTLPGQGRVELRKFVANLEKQHLTMSATLTPQTGGGMRWQGFAELSGDFGYLMKLSGLSARFTGGKSHILFSGQGMMLREQPWWQGLDGRLRLRVDDGRILEGGTLTTLLSTINLSQLPALLLGQRKDLSGPGIMYERLQMEAIMQNQNIRIRNVAMRSSAFDLVGHGSMDIAKAMIDLYLVVKPLQNLDAILAKIPLLRDILGGASHSLMRKVYHMHGPFTDAKVEAVSPEKAGLASKGFIEHLLSLPNDWFGTDEKPEAQPVR